MNSNENSSTGPTRVICVLQDVRGGVYITLIEPPKYNHDQKQVEVQLYLEAPSVPLHVKPMSWWKCNESTSPHSTRLNGCYKIRVLVFRLRDFCLQQSSLLKTF